MFATHDKNTRLDIILMNQEEVSDPFHTEVAGGGEPSIPVHPHTAEVQLRLFKVINKALCKVCQAVGVTHSARQALLSLSIPGVEALLIPS